MFRTAIIACLVAGGLLTACAEAGKEFEGDDDAPGVDAGDGKTDAASTEVSCTNKVDDDGDTLVDCSDPDCADATVCQPETPCDDGIDNEGDGDGDCADIDCDGQGFCEHGTELSCADDNDNDGDGFGDCADVDCNGQGICEHGTELSCTDGNDNDGDNLTDCADPDCATMPTCTTETVCDDGEDNDADTTTDCADFDCDGVGFCEFGAEVTCLDGNDNDGDGAMDCADSDCATTIACLFACPEGSSLSEHVAVGLPVAIPDSGEVTHAVASTATGIITKAGIQVSIDHTFVGDLFIAVQPPVGAEIALADNRGSTGDDYAGTVFTDDATTAIADGTAPFSGSFRPEQSLDQLEGTAASGMFTLRVADEASLDTGSITAYTVALCTCDDCEVGAACLDEIDNDGDMLTDCEDPDCAEITQCIPETECTDGVDNDLDGDVDCDDADCAATVCAAETDCHDEVDDDSDGLTDCQDPGCASDPTCESTGEITCNDGIDNDSDGMTDCDDPSCAAVACAVPACGAGEVLLALPAGDLPQAILDSTTTTSSLTVAATGTVARVAVGFSATHTFDGDLDISLRSPAGTVRDLSSDNGSTGDNYTGTIFIDGAATAITAGSAPFTGQFRPEQSLDVYAGETAAGTWQLDVADDAGSDTGSFTQFELALCVTP